MGKDAMSIVPPHSLEAEMAVLGSMLVEREAVERALELVDETRFYKDDHRKVFAAMAALFKAEKAVDLLTTAEELRRTGALDAVGGQAFLAECIDRVATAAHIEHYARIVHDKAVLRDLIGVARKLISDCLSEAEPTVLLDAAQTEILSVAQKETASRFVGASELMHEAVEEVERLHRLKQAVTGVATGFKSFDRMTSGLQPGSLILIAARPSQGKTALALNIAANAARRSPSSAVAFFSLEMSNKDISARLLASEAGMRLQDVRTGFLRRDKWVDLTNAAARLGDTALCVDDTPGLSVLDVRGRTRRLMNDLKKKGKTLSLVIVDYLQFMRGASRRAENRQLEVAEISRGLKFLARDLNIPVIALSQLSRRVEERGRADARPQLSDLRDSGALEQDADLVAFIYREAAGKPQDSSLDKTKAEIIIAKQRQGPTGVVEVRFNPDLTRFEDPDSGGEESWQDGQESFA